MCVMRNLTQAVSGSDVDLEDGNAAPGAPSRFTIRHDLSGDRSADANPGSCFSQRFMLIPLI